MDAAAQRRTRMEVRVYSSLEQHDRRLPSSFGPLVVDYLGRDAFIRNNRAAGRAKDLGDLEALGEAP